MHLSPITSLPPTFLSEKYKRTHGRKAIRNIKQSISTEPSVIETKDEVLDLKPLEENEPESTLADANFEPFRLKRNSSFNPTMKSPKQLMKMSSSLRAKYQAYEKPSEKVMQKIAESEARAKKLMREKHLKIKEQAEEARKKWDLLHRAIEDPLKKAQGIKLAEMAKLRIWDKKKETARMWAEQLEYLVEGQQNSIDAIKLNQHLTKRTDFKVDFIITPQEKARIEQVLALNDGGNS